LSKSLIELNLTISALAPEKAILLELVRWETHVPPLIADEPEKVVLDHFGAYDIFVRIMWKRMGTPTTEAQSGTEEEFHRAQRDMAEAQNTAGPLLFLPKIISPAAHGRKT
jgi:hypothetical protein